MNDQLHLDGVPAAARTRRLTECQREFLRYMRWTGRPLRTREARRFYADPSGALRRLERLGLVCRCGRGCWRAT